MKEWFMIAIGGMVGSLLRYGIHQLAVASFGAKFPFGTLFANLIGCFLIGLGWSLAERHGWLQGPWELAFRVGFLGGLTTFSSYGLDVIRFLQQAEYALAATALLSNLILGLFLVWLGFLAAQVVS